MNENVISAEEIRPYLEEEYMRSDKVMRYFVWAFFAFSIFIAPVHDTWWAALLGAPALVLLYYVVSSFSEGSFFNRVSISLNMVLFPHLFIYQLHGLTEAYFFAFTNLMILLMYRDWRIQLIYFGVTLTHHTVLYYLHQNGYDVQNFFLAYEEVSLVLVAIHLSAFCFGATVAGWWAWQLQKQLIKDIKERIRAKQQAEVLSRNIRLMREIQRGEFDSSYEAKDGDELGQALSQMRESLQKAIKLEESESYITKGIGTLNDILRRDFDSMHEVCGAALLHIAQHANAESGGIFLFNEDSELELFAGYAFGADQKMAENKEAGSLLADVIDRKKIVHLKDVKNYRSIFSSLGEASPRELFIIPLLTSNGELVGGLELAFLHAMTKDAQQFIKTAVRIFSASIIALQNAKQNESILMESQMLSEQMLAQEEEMRMSMEQLQDQQAYTDQQISQLTSYIDSLEDNLALLRFDEEGKIFHASEAFYSLMGYSAEEVKEKTFRDIFLRQPENTPEGYAQLMENLRKGKNICRYRKTKDGGEKMIQAQYLAQHSENGDFQGATLLILPEAQQPDTQEGPQETHGQPSATTGEEENEAAE